MQRNVIDAKKYYEEYAGIYKDSETGSIESKNIEFLTTNYI